MVYFLVCVLILLLGAVLVAVFVRRARSAVVILISILIYLPSYLLWFAIQYLNLISIDSFLERTFGIYSYEGVGSLFGKIILLGPPLIPSVGLLLWFFIIRDRGSRKGEPAG